MSEIPSDLPVSNVITVIEYREHYRTQKWWCFTILCNKFAHDEISTYLFINKDGKWKRKQKFTVKNEQAWQSIKNAHEELLPKIKVMRSA